MSRGYVGGVLYRMLPSSDPLWSDVMAYWKLDRNANDASGNGHNGSLVGSPTLVSGMENGAYLFNGSNQCVETTTLGNFGSQSLGEFSIACWMKTYHDSSPIGLFGVINDGTSTAVYATLNYAINDKEKFSIYVRDESGKVLQCNTTNNTGICDGEWHLLAITVKCSTNTVALYLDGNSKEISYTSQQTPASFANFGYPMIFGGRNIRGTADQFFNGALDDVLLVKRALTQLEIDRLYAGVDYSTHGVYTLFEHHEARRRGKL